MWVGFLRCIYLVSMSIPFPDVHSPSTFLLLDSLLVPFITYNDFSLALLSTGFFSPFQLQSVFLLLSHSPVDFLFPDSP